VTIVPTVSFSDSALWSYVSRHMVKIATVIQTRTVLRDFCFNAYGN
jgi:hypothetical protein